MVTSPCRWVGLRFRSAQYPYVISPIHNSCLTDCLAHLQAIPTMVGSCVGVGVSWIGECVHVSLCKPFTFCSYCFNLDWRRWWLHQYPRVLDDGCGESFLLAIATQVSILYDCCLHPRVSGWLLPRSNFLLVMVSQIHTSTSSFAGGWLLTENPRPYSCPGCKKSSMTVSPRKSGVKIPSWVMLAMVYQDWSMMMANQSWIMAH